jgi:hypothetical protein
MFCYWYGREVTCVLLTFGSLATGGYACMNNLGVLREATWPSGVLQGSFVLRFSVGCPMCHILS